MIKFGNTYLKHENIYLTDWIGKRIPVLPTMNTIQAGYRPTGYYRTFYWWVPRTTRMLVGEKPFFCYGRWGDSDTKTQIIAVKSCSGDNNNFNFSGILKYQKSAKQARTALGYNGRASKSDYKIYKNTIINFTGVLGYVVLFGGVQSFSSNPFNGDWTNGDEGHLFDMTIEDDDIGYIIGSEMEQLSPVRTCNCESHAYYFTTKPSEFNNKVIGDTITVTNWTGGTDVGGNMLHSSQTNFGWWWEVR